MAQGIIGSNNNVNSRGSIGSKGDSHSTIGGNFDIYGTVNNPITILEYYGDVSETATVNVNNTTKHISVDVTKLPHNLVIEDKTLDNIKTYIFNGSKDRKIILKDWTLKEVEPKSKNNLLEYSLIKDGNEVGDRICIPKDKFITSIILKFIDEASLEEVKKQCPEAKIGDPYLDITVQNVEQGHLETHLFVLMINVVDIYNAGHGLILTKVITEDNRKIMVFSVDPEVIKQDINLEGIHKKIDDEILRATEVEESLQSDLVDEIKRAKNKEDEIKKYVDNLNSTEIKNRQKEDEKLQEQITSNDIDIANLQSTKADIEGASVSLYNIDDSEIDNSVIKTSQISNSRLFNNSLEGIINTGGSTYATIDGQKAEITNWSILNATFGDEADFESAEVIISDPTTKKNPVSLNYLQNNYPTKSYVDDEVTTLFEEITNETDRATAKENELSDSIDTINTDLLQEIEDRKSADTTLQTNINNETTARTNKDTELENSISDEVNRAINKETELNTNVSNVSTRVSTIESSYVKKDGSVSMTGDLNMDSHKITNMANPINNNDAANKSYVDAALAKIDQFKYVVSTTANNTPEKVVWYNGTTQITGTLAASADTEFTIYLVPCKHTATEKQKGYDEYLAIKNNDTYSWELLGNTADIDLSSYLKVDKKMKLTDTYLNTTSANTIVRSYQSGSGEYQEMINNARVEDKNSDYQYRMNFDGETDNVYIDYHLSKTGSIYNQITGENAYISNYITGNNASLTTKIEDYANVLLYAEGDSTSETLKNAYIGKTKDGSRDGTPLFYLYNTDTDKYNTYGLAFDCSRNQLGYATLEDGKIKITDIDFIKANDFNIENGSGTKSVQTKPENSSFDFTDKNTNSGITGSVQNGAIGDYSFAANGNASAQGVRSFAQGNQTIAKGSVSHSEGENCVALANFSHAEGYASTSKGNISHAEGYNTIAEGKQSHAEGYNTKATGYTSHAEGTNTVASGENSKAVGYGCQATGTNSFAEGENTKATQYNSHAEGTLSQANAVGSHAAGYYTIANTQFQFAVGKFNNSLDTDLFQVGNGNADNDRKNAFRVLQDGRAKVQTAPSENDDITNKNYVDNIVEEKIEAEILARQTATSALESKINTEINDRQNEDANISDKIDATKENLQSQIDTITSASDVVDVVATKADLNNYDTSKLTDKDIIKVLKDEEKNNQTTYYRYDKASSKFTLIGGVGPYYTQSEVDTKVNKLSSDLTAEINTRKSEDSALGEKIESEISTRSSDVSSLTAKLTTETSERKSADTNLQTQITTNKNDITSLQTEVITKVPQTRTINSKPLSSDISLTKSDIGLSNVDNTADKDKSVASSVNAQKLVDSSSSALNVGATNKPIYFKDGVPTIGSYELNKDVPSNAVFTDTHYTSYNYVGAANSASSSATTNGNTYLKLYENNSLRSQFKLVGSGLTSVSSDTYGNITISTPSSASKGYIFDFSSTYTQESGYSISGYWSLTLYYADGTYSSHTVYALGGLNTKTNVTAVSITSHLSGNIGIYSTESSGYVFSTKGIQTASSAIPTSSTVTTSQFILLSDFDVTINFEQDA